MIGEPVENASAALRVRNLTVRYGDRVALDDISFDLAPGEILGIRGASASGKTSLAWALLGLTRREGRIERGLVEVGGRDLMSMPEADRAAMRGRQIALIVQNARGALNPLVPIGRQIERIGSTHGRVTDAVALLRQMGVPEPALRARAHAHELSGGMAQRALISMALAADAAVLVADEPTSGLDVTVQAQFLDFIWTSVRARRTALLLISQDEGILANYCDRVLSLEAGRLLDPIPPSGSAPPRSRPTSAEHSLRSDTGDDTEARLIRISGIHKRFPVRGTRRYVHAVTDVSLDLAPAEVLGLVGESGSGKTTVGRCVLGLLRPDQGTIEVLGRELGGMRANELRQLRRHVQIVRQDPFDSFDPRWAISESLAEPLRVHERLSGSTLSKRLEALIDAVGVDPAALSARPLDLSAGTLQRLAIARALATEPRLLVLDEPTSMLGDEARSALIEILERMRVERRVGMLLISHDLTTIARLCGRVAVMYLGQIVEVAPTEQIFAAPQHPYSQGLLSAHLPPTPQIRRVDRPLPPAMRGEIPSPVDLPDGCFYAARCPRFESHCQVERQALLAGSPDHAVRCFKAQAQRVS